MTSTDNSAWAQGLEVQGVSCKKELADNRGDLETTKAAQEKELLAAFDQTARLQNRIEMLLSEKSSLEDDSAGKEETVHQAITRSEELEQKHSSLKEQHHVLSNDLLNSKNDTTDGQRKLRIDLQEAQKTNEILKIALTKAEKQARFYENRMHGLNYALEQSPDRVAADNAMIEAKDSMFSRLEEKAGECYSAYVALEKSSRQDKERAEMEIAELKKQLKQAVALNDQLADAKAVFEQESLDVFAMLRAKIYPTDFFQAMDHHFSVVTQDSTFLGSIISEQTRELSNKDLEIASLKAEVLNLNKVLHEKEESRASLEIRLREAEDQVGGLELEMNALSSENEQVNTRNDTIIADLEKGLRVAYASLDETRDERERGLIKSKDSEVLHLKDKCNEFCQANRQLKRQVHTQEQNIKDFTEEVYVTHARVAEVSVDLKAAEKKVTTLEQQVRGELGLPATVNILEVLNQKIELDEGRQQRLSLEDELQTARSSAEQRQAAFNRIKDQSERWLHGMQDVGLELVTRLQRAQGARVEPRLDETDEELENKLRNFWEAFDG